MFELVDGYSQSNAVIKVIGIGGGGGNALEHMLATNMEGVEFDDKGKVNFNIVGWEGPNYEYLESNDLFPPKQFN